MAIDNGIMPVMDYSDNNNNWVWIFMIFALMGWGRGGYGYGEGCVTPVQMQEGFNNAEVVNKLDRLDNVITNGLSDLGYTTNLNIANGFASTKEAIGQVRFDTQLQTQQIMKNDCENTQKILDKLSESRISEMQNRINQLELQASLGNVVRYPSATTYTAGFSPCFNQGCGCD